MQVDLDPAGEAAPVDQLQQLGPPLQGVVGRAVDDALREQAVAVLGSACSPSSASSSRRPRLLVSTGMLAPSGDRSGASASDERVGRVGVGRTARPARWSRAGSPAAACSSSSGSSDSMASLISNRSSVGAPISRPALLTLLDGVAGPLLVAGHVGGVQRPEAGDVLDEVVAVDEDPLLAGRRRGPEPVAEVDEDDRLLAAPGGVVQQGRELAGRSRRRPDASRRPRGPGRPAGPGRGR